MPRVVLSQSEPWPSSSTCEMLSLSNPSLAVTLKKCPLRRALSPPPKVPIQSVPSRSSTNERISLLDNPSVVVKSCDLPSLSRHKPCPYEPAHKPPSRVSHSTTSASFNRGPPGITFRARPPWSSLKPAGKAAQNLPARSSRKSKD